MDTAQAREEEASVTTRSGKGRAGAGDLGAGGSIVLVGKHEELAV